MISDASGVRNPFAKVAICLLIGVAAALVIIDRVDSSSAASDAPEDSIQSTFEVLTVDPENDPAAAYAPEPGDEVPMEWAPDPPPELRRTQRGRDQIADKLGYHPPAPSKARGMTPEWREFADGVDRACAETYRYAQARAYAAERLALAKGWGHARTTGVVDAVWSAQGPQIVRATNELGSPPARAGLFQRWRDNVMARSRLRRRASEAALRGDLGLWAAICQRINALKRESDRLGQRFGLRICTSN